MPLCLNKGHVSELHGTHRRGWSGRGLCWGLHVSALGVRGGLCDPPLPVAQRTVFSACWLPMVGLCLAPLGPPGVLSALRARDQSGWVWLQQSHRLLGEGWAGEARSIDPFQCVAATSARARLPAACGRAVHVCPAHVVWSLPSGVRLQRGLVSLGPTLSLCVLQVPPYQLFPCVAFTHQAGSRLSSANILLTLKFWQMHNSFPFVF